ncbi:MAG: TonB family protein [Pseudomonadota bacterium]
MLRYLDFPAFLLLAGVLHLLLWPRESSVGASAAGAGGADLVSLVASSAAIEQMVAEFDRPPVAVQALTPPEPPSIPPTPEVMALPDPPPQGRVALLEPPRTPPLETPQTAPQTPPPPAPPEDPPEVPPEPAEAESEQAVQNSPRPPTRPERQRTETAAEERPASAASPSRRAAGAGNTGAAGNRGTARSATLSDAARQSLLAEWGGAIRAQVQRRSPRDNTASYVTVRMNVSRTGSLIGLQVVASSGSARFNEKLLASIRSIGRLPAAPQRFAGDSNTFDLTIKSN